MTEKDVPPPATPRPEENKQTVEIMSIKDLKKFMAPSAPEAQTAEAARSASPQYPEWQPIETAPKDGRRILCHLPDSDFTQFDPCVLQWAWDDETERDAWVDGDDFAPDPQPSHWMPLPAPPEAK